MLNRLRKTLAAMALLAVAACGVTAPPCPAPPSGDVVFIVSHGWHVDLGLPAAALTGPLAVYRAVFPGARVVMFGYGKRTFLTAPADDWSEYLLGPFPGPAAIEATGLAVAPEAAYDPADVTELALPPGGAARLAAFIGTDLARDAAGGPRYIGPGPAPGTLFFAASSGYSLFHTRNTWAAEALHAAGANVSADGVIFSGQVDRRAASAGACHAASSIARRASPYPG